MKLVKMIAAGMVVGTVGMSAMGVSADEIRDGQTEAEVTVAGGELTFSNVLPKIEFAKVTLDGKDQTVQQTATNELGINDYRGVTTAWDLQVKEQAAVEGEKTFSDQGMIIKLNPTLNNTAGTALDITDENKTVATGSRFENTVGLNASLDVPKDVTAATYTTQIEWTLKPAE